MTNDKILSKLKKKKFKEPGIPFLWWLGIIIGCIIVIPLLPVIILIAIAQAEL